MMLSEILATLPHGLHDAELHGFEVEYVRRTLRLVLTVWIGDLEVDEERELYRPALITFERLAYLVVEPPDPQYPWLESGPIVIDAGEGRPSECESQLPEAPSGTEIGWMYLQNTNRFLLFAAGDATFEWTGPQENRTRHARQNTR